MLRFNKKLLKNTRGDTIIEVLLAVAIMSLVLAISYNLSNKNSQFVQTAKERGEAQKLAEEQLERLRGYITQTTDWSSANLCFNAEGNPTSAADSCSFGPEGRYAIGIHPTDEDTYTARVSWDTLSGNPASLELSYRLPQPVPFHIALTPEPEPEPGPVDTDGDGVMDPSDACPTVYALTPNGCPLPPPPVQFAVSRTSHTFPSWHLYNTGGSRPTVAITVSNPSSSAVSNVGSIAISGRTDSFQITSNGCANRTLNPGATCSITVQWYPPSGTANNYFGNSGGRNATLTINGGAGSSARTVALSGMTYSDRMRPGDQILQTNFGIVAYNPTCYINVENCGIPLTGIASNGNLYIGGTYCLYGGYGSPPYSGGARFAMQTDGNLVFYGIGGAYRYASWTFASNLWLMVQMDNNGVYITNGSGGPLVKWIHYGGSCFAW